MAEKPLTVAFEIGAQKQSSTTKGAAFHDVILVEVEHFTPNLHELNSEDVKIVIRVTCYSKKTFS